MTKPPKALYFILARLYLALAILLGGACYALYALVTDGAIPGFVAMGCAALVASGIGGRFLAHPGA